MSTELSGVDLARQALVAAREAAKKNGASRKEKPKRRTGQLVRREGREPLGLGAAVTMMMIERGMVAPVAVGSIFAQFDSILAAVEPGLVGHAQAVKFDADTGRLDVAPHAPAYGTKLRWIAPRLVAAANQKVQGAKLCSVHVLPPAPRTAAPITTATPGSAPQTAAAPPRPVKTRETASDGYRRALEVHRAAASARMDAGEYVGGQEEEHQ